MSSEREPPMDDFLDADEDQVKDTTEEIDLEPQQQEEGGSSKEEEVIDLTPPDETPEPVVQEEVAPEVKEEVKQEEQKKPAPEENEQEDDLFTSAKEDPAASMQFMISEEKESAPEESISAKKPIVLKDEPISAPILEEERDPDEIIITVSDPHKIGDGMNAYMSYHVKTKTTISTFKRPELVVDRRFSDFLGLHEKLLAKHRHVGCIVPPAPEKNFVNMTRVKMAKTDEEAAAIDFVEKRRASLERYLNRVALHPTLLKDSDFCDFLEQDELPQATNTRALSGAGMMRLVKNVEGALNKITIKMTEEDSWFEEKQQQVDTLEQQLRKLHGVFEGLVHHRKELAVSTASFAKSAATLGNAEEHTALSRALSQLSDALEKIETVQQDQANKDYYEISEQLGDYVRIILEIKEVFMVRVKAWQNWQNAESLLQRKREQEVKLQHAGKPDKVTEVKAEIVDLEHRVETAKKDFDTLSAAIKLDINRFERCRISEFRVLITSFLTNVIKSQEQIIKNWEGFMPEARAIA